MNNKCFLVQKNDLGLILYESESTYAIIFKPFNSLANISKFLFVAIIIISLLRWMDGCSSAIVEVEWQLPLQSNWALRGWMCCSNGKGWKA